MQTIHFVQLHQVPIFQQLQLEEALLRADQRNWCLINSGSSPAIVMGISGQVHELIHVEHLAQTPMPIIRRFSGGGTVVIDDNTYFVTFIFNASSLAVSPFPEKIMQWTEEFYRPLFQPLPFQLQENDYVIGKRKCGGNAQSIIKGRWLHHSSFLWDYCPKRMSCLKLPHKTPTYRQRRAHDDFLCRLKDYWENPSLFQESLKEQLREHFILVETYDNEIQSILDKPHRKTAQALHALNLNSY